MFESIMKFFKKLGKVENKETKSKETAKERLHLVLMQDRANVSADFLEMMKQEIIEVIKKYIEVDEKEIDVRLTNEVNEDGTTGAPSLYANIPIMNIKNEMKKDAEEKAEQTKQEEKVSLKLEKVNQKKDNENKEKPEQKEIKQEELVETNKEDAIEEKQEQNAEELKPEKQQEENQEVKIEEKKEESGA